MSVPYEIPIRPQPGETPWHLETQFGSLQVRMRELESAYGHILDSFDGATDDQKLTNALAYAAAQTYPPPIRLGNRHYTFSKANREPFDGMRILGPSASSAPEKFGATKMVHRVQLSFDGSWFHNTAGKVRVWGVTLANLSFAGSAGARVLTNAANSQWSLLLLHNISAFSIRSVLGSLDQPFTMTGCFLTGSWHVNSCYSTAFHLSGSDNVLFSDGGLLDSSPAHLAEGGDARPGMAHLWLNYLDYTRVGRLFITCEGPWRGIRITGPEYGMSTEVDNHGTITFPDGIVVQGRGTGGPCSGACIRVEGGTAKFRDPFIDFGMADPGGAGGDMAGDRGVVHQTGGYLLLDSPQYVKVASLSETVPFVYSTGDSYGRVRDVTRGRMAWERKPRARIVNGSNLRADDSFEIVAD